MEAVKSSALEQEHVPIFKLISLDRSGGSCELCLHNWQVHRSTWDAINPFARGVSGKKTIGKEGRWVNIKGRVVFHKVYKGSYNYSETIRTGFAAHNHRDIKPHKTSRTFYVDPSMHSELEARRFPEKDPQGKFLADMI